MRDTLDKDMAAIGKFYHAGWTGYTKEKDVREVIGRKRWFMRCCGGRMHQLLELVASKTALAFPGGSRGRQINTYKDASICLKCGFVDDVTFLGRPR